MTTETDISARVAELVATLRASGHFVTLAGAVSEISASEVLGVKPRTLRAWRQSRTGPRYYGLGRRVLYPLEGIVQFLDESMNVGGSARHCAADCDSTRHFRTSTERPKRG